MIKLLCPIALRACLSFFLLAILTTLQAQTADTLVRFRDLTFQSEFEKETFRRFEKKDIDPFALFMASGSLLGDEKIRQSQKKFYDYIVSVGQETSGKKNDKRTKIIYDNIHKQFLSKYELKNRFEEIFYNGYYNCVSATALYALAFDKLNIPYSIKEEPGHVYLIAWPNAERIILQTTSPTGGFYTLSDEFKQRFVKALKDQKLISAQEFSTQGAANLFDKHYFASNQDLTAVQLAGIQYMNEGLYKCDDKQFEEAYHQFEKAYVLFPCERATQLLVVAGSQAFNNHKQNDSTQAVLLAKLSRFKDYGLPEDAIKNEFIRATHTLLFESNKRKEYDHYYDILNTSIESKTLRGDIMYIHDYETARFLYNQAKYKEGIPYVEKVITQKPNDLEAQSLFINTVGQTLSSMANPDIIKQLEGYNTQFTSLRTNNNFNAMLATAYLIQFNRSYATNKISEGDKYKTQFEALANQYPTMTVQSDLIGQSYSTAAVYYYRKGQVVKAKQILQTGLRYAPNSYELTARQDMIR